MPIYEFQCAKCDLKFEMRRSFSDSDDEIKCPRCGSRNPRRVFSTFLSSGHSESACAPAPSGGG